MEQATVWSYKHWLVYMNQFLLLETCRNASTLFFLKKYHFKCGWSRLYQENNTEILLFSLVVFLLCFITAWAWGRKVIVGLLWNLNIIYISELWTKPFENNQFISSGLLVKSEVLTTVNMKITVFWDVVMHSLVNRYPRFGGTCCFHLQGRRESHVGALGNICRDRRKENRTTSWQMGDSGP
jgi:hypothetical protein